MSLSVQQQQQPIKLYNLSSSKMNNSDFNNSNVLNNSSNSIHSNNNIPNQNTATKANKTPNKSSASNISKNNNHYDISTNIHNNNNNPNVNSSNKLPTTISTMMKTSSANNHSSSSGSNNNNTIARCAACRKLIKERFLLKALDQVWHEDCLKCSCCDCRLGEVGSTLFTKANLLLCRRDYLRLFGTTGYCSACSKMIPAFEMVMRAKHNVYHLECFACQQCNHRFCVGDRYFLCNNRILCEYDYEERLLLARASYEYATYSQQQHFNSSNNNNHHMNDGSSVCCLNNANNSFPSFNIPGSTMNACETLNYPNFNYQMNNIANLLTVNSTNHLSVDNNNHINIENNNHHNINNNLTYNASLSPNYQQQNQQQQQQQQQQQPQQQTQQPRQQPNPQHSRQPTQHQQQPNQTQQSHSTNSDDFSSGYGSPSSNSA